MPPRKTNQPKITDFLTKKKPSPTTSEEPSLLFSDLLPPTIPTTLSLPPSIEQTIPAELIPTPQETQQHHEIFQPPIQEQQVEAFQHPLFLTQHPTTTPGVSLPSDGSLLSLFGGEYLTDIIPSLDQDNQHHPTLFETDISKSLENQNAPLNVSDLMMDDLHISGEGSENFTAPSIDELKNLDIGKYIEVQPGATNQAQTAMQICNIFRGPTNQQSSELLKQATSSLIDQQENDSDDDDNRSVMTEASQITSENYKGDDFDEIYGPDEGEGDYEYLDDILKGMLRRKKRKRAMKAKKTRKKKEDKIPKEVKEMLGEANLEFIGANFSKAVQILLEVVRVCPNISDPYHTLGLIYEELGIMDKATDFYLIAGLLSPTNLEFWIRLSELAILTNKLQLAAYCLRRIYLIDPKNYNARIKQCELFMILNQPARAINGYKSLLKQFPGDVPVVMSLAKIYYELNRVFDAIDVLQQAISRDEQRVDLTLVNMLSELFINEGWYEKAIKLIERISVQQNCPIEIMPPDISSKYAISQTYLGKLSNEKVESIFEDILKSPVTEFGDLFFNIAEMYYVVNEFKKALNVYSLLTTSEVYNKPSIWLRIAECYKSLEEVEESIKYCEMVLHVIPDNVEARILLSEVYKDVGDIQKAIEVLEQSGSEKAKKDLASLKKSFDKSDHDDDSNYNVLSDNSDKEDYSSDEDSEQEKDPDFNPEEIEPSDDDINLPDDMEDEKTEEQNRTEKVKDIRIMVKKAWILHSTGQHEEFIKTALPVVLSILDLDQENPEWMRELGKRKKRIILNYDIGLKRQRKKVVDESKEDGWTWTEALSAMGDYNLYTFIVALCKVLAYCQKNEECLRILSVLLLNSRSTRKKFTFKSHEEKQRKRQHLRYLYVAVSYNSGFYKRAYNAIRPIISDKPYSIPLLNLFNKITTRVGNILANHGFMLRLLDKHPQSVPLMLLVGHNCAMSGSHKLAIAEYFRAYRFMPNEPIISLCLGLSYLNLVMNRRTANRNLHVMQAFTFLYRYFELREGNQEAHFNLARAYHQLRLYHMATPYYKKVLELSDSGQILPDSDLKREAAYNLSLIYKESGNYALVEYLTDKYLTI